MVPTTPRNAPLVHAVAVAVGIALLGAAGCSGRSCTAIGAMPPTVYVVVPDLDAWEVQELCVGGTCVDGFEIRVAAEPRTYPFTLVVTGPDGATFERSGEVTTVESRPNGPSCPPSSAHARLRVAEDGTVTAGWP